MIKASLLSTYYRLQVQQ